MMISPEAYQAEFLTGRTTAELMTEVRSLKQRSGRLRHQLAQAADDERMIERAPAAAAELVLVRQYLALAKAAYAAQGGVYVPSRAERRVAQFDEDLANPKQIEFAIGGYPCGDDVTRIDIASGIIEYGHDPAGARPAFKPQGHQTISRAAFLRQLRALHIGEWRARSNSQILDGTQWELRFDYGAVRRPRVFSGSNIFPPGFAQLQALMTTYERLTLTDEGKSEDATD